jgi:hypothetical protein
VRSLLAVSWELPPMYGPRAAQVSRVLAQLPALGWRPTVIALEPRRRGPHWFDDAAASRLADVEVIRVPSPQEWLVMRAARRIAPPLFDRPDAARPWVGPASRAAVRAAVERQPAVLITFAQPWSDHLIGLRVHHATKLPWVAHFSDPWADSPYATARQRAIWRPMEEEVVREASAVAFVTDETADLVMRKYPEQWRSKAAVVPHGFDASGMSVSRTRSSQDGPLRMLYAGRFYRGVRTPLPLLRAIAALNGRAPLGGALHVTFLGPHLEEFARDASALGIGSLVTFRGRAAPPAVAAAAADSDVLLVIDAPSDGPSVFLPSKLIDYLAFRKPIFGITPANGASATLLRRLGAHVAPPDDEASIAASLDDLIARWRAGTLDVGPSFDAVAADYDIRATARRLDDVLVHVCG